MDLEILVSVSSADRVWVWRILHFFMLYLLSCFSILGGSSVGVARPTSSPTPSRSTFQYPRRIECGCGLCEVNGDKKRAHGFSILGGSSVGVAAEAIVEFFGLDSSFSILGGSSVGVAVAGTGKPHALLERFSILGGSSVGVAFVSSLYKMTFDEQFQYPRRIECGCGHHK